MPSVEGLGSVNLMVTYCWRMGFLGEGMEGGLGTRTRRVGAD